MCPNFSEKEVWPAIIKFSLKFYQVIMFYCSHFISGYTTTTTTCEYIHVFKIYTYKAKSSELERIKANCVQIFPKKKSGLQSSNLSLKFYQVIMFYCSHFISGYTTTTTTCEYIHVFKIYTYKAKSSELERIKANCVQIFPKKKSGLQSSNLASSFIKLSCFTAATSYQVTLKSQSKSFRKRCFTRRTVEVEDCLILCILGRRDPQLYQQLVVSVVKPK